MIHRYTIQLIDAFYRVTEEQYMSVDALLDLADDLFRDKMCGEALWYLGRAKEGGQWIDVSSYAGPSFLYQIPDKARRKLRPGYTGRIEKGKVEVVTCCIY